MGLCQGCEAPPGLVVDLPNLVLVHELEHPLLLSHISLCFQGTYEAVCTLDIDLVGPPPISRNYEEINKRPQAAACVWCGCEPNAIKSCDFPMGLSRGSAY